MARWYWAYDYPDRSNGLAVQANQLRATLGFPSASRLLRCPDQVCLDRIHQAAEAYRGPRTSAIDPSPSTSRCSRTTQRC